MQPVEPFSHPLNSMLLMCHRCLQAERGAIAACRVEWIRQHDLPYSETEHLMSAPPLPALPRAPPACLPA